MTKKKGLLRSKDVAWILDCSPDEVVGLARSGQLKGFKDGRFWKFRRRNVETYKKERKREETAERLSPFA